MKYSSIDIIKLPVSGYCPRITKTGFGFGITRRDQIIGLKSGLAVLGLSGLLIHVCSFDLQVKTQNV